MSICKKGVQGYLSCACDGCAREEVADLAAENTRLLSTLESCRAELAGAKEANRKICESQGDWKSPYVFRAERAEAALKDSRELYAVAESLRQHAEAELAEARAEVAKLVQSTGEHITVRSELRAENAALLAKIEKAEKVAVLAKESVSIVWTGVEYVAQYNHGFHKKAEFAKVLSDFFALSPAPSTPTKEK